MGYRTLCFFQGGTLEHVCGLRGRIKKRERLMTHEGEGVTTAAKPFEGETEGSSPQVSCRVLRGSSGRMENMSNIHFERLWT